MAVNRNPFFFGGGLVLRFRSFDGFSADPICCPSFIGLVGAGRPAMEHFGHPLRTVRAALPEPDRIIIVARRSCLDSEEQYVPAAAERRDQL